MWWMEVAFLVGYIHIEHYVPVFCSMVVHTCQVPSVPISATLQIRPHMFFLFTKTSWMIFFFFFQLIHICPLLSIESQFVIKWHNSNMKQKENNGQPWYHLQVWMLSWGTQVVVQATAHVFGRHWSWAQKINRLFKVIWLHLSMIVNVAGAQESWINHKVHPISHSSTVHFLHST